jgi:hypothetical protein
MQKAIRLLWLIPVLEICASVLCHPAMGAVSISPEVVVLSGDQTAHITARLLTDLPVVVDLVELTDPSQGTRQPNQTSGGHTVAHLARQTDGSFAGNLHLNQSQPGTRYFQVAAHYAFFLPIPHFNGTDLRVSITQRPVSGPPESPKDIMIATSSASSLNGLNLSAPLPLSYKLFRHPLTFRSVYVGIAFDYEKGTMYPLEPILLDNPPLNLTEDSSLNSPSYLISKNTVQYKEGYLGSIKFFQSQPDGVRWGNDIQEPWEISVFIINYKKTYGLGGCADHLIEGKPAINVIPINNVTLVYDHLPDLANQPVAWEAYVCGRQNEFRFLFDISSSVNNPAEVIQVLQTFRELN